MLVCSWSRIDALLQKYLSVFPGKLFYRIETLFRSIPLVRPLPLLPHSPPSAHSHNQTKPPHYSLSTAFSPLLPSVPTPASKIRRLTSRCERASFQKIRYILSIVKRCQFKASRGPRKLGFRQTFRGEFCRLRFKDISFN